MAYKNAVFPLLHKLAELIRLVKKNIYITVFFISYNNDFIR